jgi:hypothetical protein
MERGWGRPYLRTYGWNASITGLDNGRADRAKVDWAVIKIALCITKRKKARWQNGLESIFRGRIERQVPL